MINSLEDKPLEEMIISAQNGDISVLNHLLRTYQPFIAKCVSEVCKRYINPRTDDEFSIGLSAFNEAINSYSPEKGSSFLPFAKLVIKRKIIDYIRANQRGIKAVSLDETYDDVQMENPMEIRIAKEKYRERQDVLKLTEEIFDFKQKLSEFKLSFEELTKVSPKHRDARDSAVRVARVLYEEENLREYVFKKKKIPMKHLANKVDVSKKTLERNRKFILAIFIVLSEEFIYLKDYLKGVGQ
ncbi:RNA polymerase sigma factor SigI [Oceanobacillus senegalensis]|uniref:RNA polymerase sigma factor SigI n=1 Tax=Oceanobacillus senegalensis TaxID=1936063 RepID=UPI000A30BB4D|nr:RNA polymerase sigma factor SigI [Oceanobacillus senegalensis]